MRREGIPARKIDYNKIVATRRRNGSYKFSPEWRRNISSACKRRDLRGSRNPNWKGGCAAEHARLRKTVRYAQWRTAVFQRDDYRCQGCGKRGGKLQADHELPFSLFPGLRFEILNGRTFCEPCHIKYGWHGNQEERQEPYVFKAENRGGDYVYTVVYDPSEQVKQLSLGA